MALSKQKQRRFSGILHEKNIQLTKAQNTKYLSGTLKIVVKSKNFNSFFRSFFTCFPFLRKAFSRVAVAVALLLCFKMKLYSLSKQKRDFEKWSKMKAMKCYKMKRI